MRWTIVPGRALATLRTAILKAIGIGVGIEVASWSSETTLSADGVGGVAFSNAATIERRA